MQELLFRVVDRRVALPAGLKSTAYLIIDHWDDWFRFSTMYQLVIFDELGKLEEIGSLKIGQLEMPDSQRRPDIPVEFPTLEKRFFSLGQDETYYENLKNLGETTRLQVLTALRDISLDLELFEQVKGLEVTQRSLLRHVSIRSVLGQFNRLARGGARLSEFRFAYKAPPQVASRSKPFELTFDVTPEVQPPTNIHVLIGRNGVGKTYVLNRMAKSLVDADATKKQSGEFKSLADDESGPLFANLVFVTFSAFDEFDPFIQHSDPSQAIRYSYVGLRRPKEDGKLPAAPKSPNMLAREFADSVRTCTVGSKLNRWRTALEILEADPVFKDADVSSLASQAEGEDFRKAALATFKKLSSGHKIVLLTITRLVEFAEERTLVLMDEPEAHLHPPLLSAFIRSLSDLLIDRNGVGIVASHSPVVLQEVPRRCVWKLRRSGREVGAERPDVETFGENVGVLTREIFGFEVTNSGFHRMVQAVVEEGVSYEAALEAFGEQLGGEGRAILRALITERNDKTTQENG